MFDKNLWSSLTSNRAVNRYPTLPCPHCNVRALKLDHQSFGFRDAPISSGRPHAGEKVMALRSKEVATAFGENNVLGVVLGVASVLELSNLRWVRFVSFFVCGNCMQSVAATGSATASAKVHPRVDAFSIKVEYFSPPIPMFQLTITTPESVNKELIQAFAHFHSDLTASGAKLRRAVEKFCDELGFKEGNLHRRIEAMRTVIPYEAGLLSALKLVGNEATHSDGIEESDLLLAFEILEVSLDIFRRQSVEKRVSESVAQLDAKFLKPKTIA